MFSPINRNDSGQRMLSTQDDHIWCWVSPSCFSHPSPNFNRCWILLRLSYTWMIPVSLLAIIMVTKQVFGWMAEMTSSISIRPVRCDAGTYVTAKRRCRNSPHKKILIRLSHMQCLREVIFFVPLVSRSYPSWNSILLQHKTRQFLFSAGIPWRTCTLKFSEYNEIKRQKSFSEDASRKTDGLALHR